MFVWKRISPPPKSEYTDYYESDYGYVFEKRDTRSSVHQRWEAWVIAGPVARARKIGSYCSAVSAKAMATKKAKDWNSRNV